MFASDSLRRVALVMVLVSVMLPATLTMATAGNLTVRRRSILFSADFETGDFSQWTDNYNYGTGSVSIVASSFQHSGTYSNYAYYIGAPGGDNRRAYPSYYPTNRPAHFLVEVWVYVPSIVNGETVKLTDWSSFASLWVNKGYWREAYPITVDNLWWANGRTQELTMCLHMLPSGQSSVLQTNPIKWPFDKWFRIGIEVDLHPGTANSRVTVYQDGVAVLNWSGDLGTQGLSGPVVFDGLSDAHFGLYAGSKQGTFAVYNDDIYLRL